MQSKSSLKREFFCVLFCVLWLHFRQNISRQPCQIMIIQFHSYFSSSAIYIYHPPKTSFLNRVENYNLAVSSQTLIACILCMTQISKSEPWVILIEHYLLSSALNSSQSDLWVMLKIVCMNKLHNFIYCRVFSLIQF